MSQKSITFYFPINLYLPNRSGLFVIATAIFMIIIGYFSFKILIDEIWIIAILSLAMIGYGVYMFIGGVYIYFDKNPRMVIEKQGVQLYGLHRSQNCYIYFDEIDKIELMTYQGHKQINENYQLNFHDKNGKIYERPLITLKDAKNDIELNPKEIFYLLEQVHAGARPVYQYTPKTPMNFDTVKDETSFWFKLTMGAVVFGLLWSWFGL